MLETATPAQSVSPSEALITQLGIELKNPLLLQVALTHRSYAYEQDLEVTNERLELLGDSVLNLVVTDMIYKRFPHHTEGDLAKLRASLVSTTTLAEVAATLDLGESIMLGRGEILTGGRSKTSILADALEAVIGAIYLDRGLVVVRQVLKSLFAVRIAEAVGRDVPRDAKTLLQELVTRTRQLLPIYQVTGTGPDHNPEFVAEVFIDDDLYGSGRGGSKKEAETAAAAQAVLRFETEIA